MNKALKIIEPVMLILVPLTLAAGALLQLEYTALFSMFVVIVALVPFFLRFELQGARPRDIMPIVVMAALAAAGRIIFAPFPNVKPTSAIVIVSGVCFGRQSGFLTGALAALASNMFFGQGPWTPWQMYAWGLVGYFAGVLAEHAATDKTPILCGYGALSGFLFGIVLDSYYAAGFIFPLTWQAVLAAYGLGLPFSIAHAVSTLIFLAIILVPWRKSIARIQRKYGIIDPRNPQKGRQAVENPRGATPISPSTPEG